MDIKANKMSSIKIPHSRDDTTIVVKAAFENTEGIKTYHDDGVRVIGKTGASLGLVTSSYGEQVIVEIPEDQPSEMETMISVTGKKEVGINVGAKPEKYVSRYIQSINNIKQNDVETIMEVLAENKVDESTKEVKHQSGQANGNWMYIVVIVVIFIFILLPILSL